MKKKTRYCVGGHPDRGVGAAAAFVTLSIARRKPLP